MADRPKMDWQPAPASLAERFATVIAEFPEATPRKMFGYPAAFVGGNLATGLYGPTWMARLPEADRDEVVALGGSPFEPMAGRPMRGYVVLPAAVVDDDAAIRAWVRRALEHTATLPAKPPR